MLSLVFASAGAGGRWGLEVWLHPQGGSGRSGEQGHRRQRIQEAVPHIPPSVGHPQRPLGLSIFPALSDAASAAAASASGSCSETQPEGKEAKT